MKPPFFTTLRQTGTLGLARTASAVITIFIRMLFKHLKHVPESAVVVVNKSKMLLFPKRGGIHLELFLHGKREPMCTRYLVKSNILKKGDVALDVGANIGYYVLIESKLIGEKGRVYAVEPVLGNFRLLVKNVKLNSLTNVSTYQLAFGDYDGKNEIYISEHSNLCRMKTYSAKDIVGTQEVQMETIDTFLQDKEIPKLIRMDVKGYEYEIIKGMTQTLKKDVILLVELHPEYLCEKINELFEILDRNCFRVRFAVFEDKVEENPILQSLINEERGYKLPISLSNVPIKELQRIIANNPEYAFNVFFEKRI